MGNMLGLLKVFERDDKQINNMKEQLRGQIHILVEKEKRFCARKNKPRIMDEQKEAQIHKLIDKCHSPYQVEGLRRIIMFYNLIPTWREVKTYSNALRDYALSDDIGTPPPPTIGGQDTP